MVNGKPQKNYRKFKLGGSKNFSRRDVTCGQKLVRLTIMLNVCLNKDIAALEEDLGISKENATASVEEDKTPMIPLPEGNVATPAKEAPPRKLNPMEELRQAGYYE